jgi:hypothetical protein
MYVIPYNTSEFPCNVHIVALISARECTEYRTAGFWRNAALDFSEEYDVTSESGELNTELAIFEQHKVEWLRSNAGEFVVISGTDVTGFYPDYESAFRAGIKSGIKGSFLVKQIRAEEPVYLIY